MISKDLKNIIEETGGRYVLIENGKPKRLPVSTGVSDGSYTELISGEIREGQEVVVESLTKARQKSGTTPRMF